eukprot:4647058-Pleurochrysis_carterae.AAC.1
MCDAHTAAPVTKRITKTSDADHPFHPCDDIDSDDLLIEPLLDSSSSNSRDENESRSSEQDYDPAYPFRDPFDSAEAEAAWRARVAAT